MTDPNSRDTIEHNATNPDYAGIFKAAEDIEIPRARGASNLDTQIIKGYNPEKEFKNLYSDIKIPSSIGVNSVVIGRSDFIRDNASNIGGPISREHLRITYESLDSNPNEKGFFITDMSRNGTTLNGRTMQPQRAYYVKEGYTLLLAGSIACTVRFETTDTGKFLVLDIMDGEA